MEISIREDVARRRIGVLAWLHRLDVTLLEAMNQHKTAPDAEMSTGTDFVSSNRRVKNTMRSGLTLVIAGD